MLTYLLRGMPQIRRQTMSKINTKMGHRTWYLVFLPFFFLSSFFNLTFLLCSTKSTLNFLFYTYKQSDCKGWTSHPIIHIWTIIYCLHILIVKYPGNIFSTFYTVFLASDPLLVKLSTAIVVYSRTRNITALHSSRAARNVNVAWLLKVSKVCHHAAVFSHATLLLGPTFVTEITHPSFVAYFSAWGRCSLGEGVFLIKETIIWNSEVLQKALILTDCW